MKKTETKITNRFEQWVNHVNSISPKEMREARLRQVIEDNHMEFPNEESYFHFVESFDHDVY